MNDAHLLDRLRKLDCASLADVDKSVAVMDAGLRPLKAGLKMVGVARTVRCFEDFLPVIEALGAAAANEVLVVDTAASTRAVVGELFSLEAERRGLSGIIVDGPVRDIATIRTLSMPVYARSFCPVSGTTRQPGEQQIQVQCGGVSVHPGDIVFGDDDGILVLDSDALRTRLDRAEEIQSAELEIRRRMASGTSLFSMLNAEEHIEARKRDQDSALAFRLE